MTDVFNYTDDAQPRDQPDPPVRAYYPAIAGGGGPVTVTWSCQASEHLLDVAWICDGPLSGLVLHDIAQAKHMSGQGYVLGPTEGEHLIRNAGSLLIEVDPSRVLKRFGDVRSHWHLAWRRESRCEPLLLWVVAPPGIEAFFREVSSAPGVPPKQLTREQLNEIAQKHGMQFK